MIQIRQMTVQELNEKLEGKNRFFLIDCREKNEYELARIEGSKLIPLSEFANKATKELKPEDEIVVHCHHGGRSQKACEYLANLGYKNVANLQGGIDCWSQEIDPEVPRY